jgi:hypothetical protein
MVLILINLLLHLTIVNITDPLPILYIADEASQGREIIEAKLTGIQDKIQYFDNQVQMALKEVNYFEKLQDYEGYQDAKAAYDEHLTNLKSERKASAFWQAKLDSGDFSTKLESLAGSKRKAS